MPRNTRQVVICVFAFACMRVRIHRCAHKPYQTNPREWGSFDAGKQDIVINEYTLCGSMRAFVGPCNETRERKETKFLSSSIAS